MKKIIAVAVFGALTAATAATAATIVGSKHDLSSTGTASMSSAGQSSTQICIYCHAPHNANLSLPLWNRSNPTASGFTLYSGLNMANASFKTGFTSDSTSLFCMSCHDGQTAISAVYNAGVIDGSGTTALKTHNAKAGAFYTNPLASGLSTNLTTDLSKTHPINFPVNNTSAADGSHALNFVPGDTFMGPVAAATQTALGVSGVTKTFPLFKAVQHADSLRQSTTSSLECGSCHAVHDSAYSPFLRDTMAGSQLCLGCHNK